MGPCSPCSQQDAHVHSHRSPSGRLVTQAIKAASPSNCLGVQCCVPHLLNAILCTAPCRFTVQHSAACEEGESVMVHWCDQQGSSQDPKESMFPSSVDVD
jgi:hypothetical protein